MNAMTTNRVERSFSRCFDSYHENARQQASIAQHLVARMAALGAPDRFATAFEFGCGTGLLTEALLSQFEVDHLTLNDLTPSAAQTAEAFGAAFRPGDVCQVTWPQDVSLVVSASTIQWVDAPGVLLRQAAAALAPGGWLAISGFGPEQYRELVALGSSAQAPGLSPPSIFAEALAGLPEITVREVAETTQQSWFATPGDVLRHLRRTGVNGTRARGWTKADLARFTQDYIAKFATEAGVPLTYHPVWIIAERSA